MRLSIFPIAAPLLLASALLASCKPEKVKPTEPVKEPSKFELIPGKYNVYDTVGIFLYEMEIKHKNGVAENGIVTDSFTFINLDGQFNYTYYQTNLEPPSWPKNFFELGSFDPIIDSNGKRTYFSSYMNNYRNDSIFMHFEKNNIRYYIPEMVPYKRVICKHIGVKQH